MLTRDACQILARTAVNVGAEYRPARGPALARASPSRISIFTVAYNIGDTPR